MRAARFVIVSCIAAAVVALGVSTSAQSQQRQPSDAGAPSGLPACVSVSTQARYVPYGYNHVVILKNGCSKSATCGVATDVSPQVTSVDVPSVSTLEVLTFTASPAQTFIARVACTLH